MSNEVATRNGQPPAAIDQSSGIDINASKELQIAAGGAYAVQEIQASIVVAKRFPRTFDEVWGRVMKSCQRKSLAEKAAYSYPRGGSNISGPSVYLARVIAGNYGNLRFGVDVLRDDDNSRLIRGWCWDIETNTKVHFDDDFQKLIYRKQGGWIKPDERDLRELTNKRGAILMRNAIYNIVPRDLVDDALAQARVTMKSELKDPDGEKKRLILEFDRIGVSVEMINLYLGHKIWDADDIIELKGIANAIKDGAAKRDDYFAQEIKPASGGIDLNQMSPGDPATHQGYEKPKDELADLRTSCKNMLLKCVEIKAIDKEYEADYLKRIEDGDAVKLDSILSTLTSSYDEEKSMQDEKSAESKSTAKKGKF